MKIFHHKKKDTAFEKKSIHAHRFWTYTVVVTLLAIILELVFLFLYFQNTGRTLDMEPVLDQDTTLQKLHAIETRVGGIETAVSARVGQ